MAEIRSLDSPVENINFINDRTDPYLLPSQIWYSRLFTHYTLSSASNGQGGNFDLAELGASIQAANRLANSGWETGCYVGKIMTSGEAQLEAFQVFSKQNEGKSRELSRAEILPLLREHVGFTTSLFVSQLDVRLKVRRDWHPAPAVPDRQTLPHLVAGISTAGHRVLRRVSEDRVESYYGYFPGETERLDPDTIPAHMWEHINDLHRLFYDQTVEAIMLGALQPQQDS